jgi:hypothetical protein
MQQLIQHGALQLSEALCSTPLKASNKLIEEFITGNLTRKTVSEPS